MENVKRMKMKVIKEDDGDRKLDLLEIPGSGKQNNSEEAVDRVEGQI